MYIKNQPTSLNYRGIDSGIVSQSEIYNISNIMQSIGTLHSELNQINTRIERLSSDDPFFNRFGHILNDHVNCLVAILEVALKTIEISAIRGSNLLLVQKLTSDAMDKLQKLTSQLQNMSQFLQTLDGKTGKDKGVDLNNINDLITDQMTKKYIGVNLDYVYDWSYELENTPFGLWLLKNDYCHLTLDDGVELHRDEAIDFLKNIKDGDVTINGKVYKHSSYVKNNNGYPVFKIYMYPTGTQSGILTISLDDLPKEKATELEQIIKYQKKTGLQDMYGISLYPYDNGYPTISSFSNHTLFSFDDPKNPDIVSKRQIVELKNYLDASKFDDDGILKNFCQTIDYIDHITHNKGTRSSISIADFKHYMLRLMLSSIAVLNDIPSTFSTLFSNFDKNTQANLNESIKNLNSVLKDNLQPQVNKVQEALKSINNQIEKTNSDYLMLLSRLYN